ncbi:MAG TPA: peptide ABC transporter substrate-binding protein [Candidatus Limnocylindria bacterium]|nr:peptide ABC transporter substrate-binding protein [Candidatus Limnocylindria bacterium]
MGWRRGLAMSFSAIILAAACAQTGTTSPSASATGARPSAAPQRGAGGELKILYWQPPTILNQHQATGTKDGDAARLVLEPLASWDPQGVPLANGLAAEIPTVANGGVSADFTTVTWKLRSGVKWSDGTAFTADDVVFTWQYMADPKSAVTTSDYVDGVKSVVAKDPTTVVVTYDKPNPFFYQFGVSGSGAILQKAQFKDFIGEKAKDAPGNLKPIGTGPYKVKEFKPGDNVTYELNENFRDPNKPFFKTVTFKGGGDATTAARAVFQTGDVDYAWNLQVEANILKPMSTSSTVGELFTVYGASIERLLFQFANPDASLGDKRAEPDTKHPFLTDLAVRRALAMATDRGTMAKELYGDGLSGRSTCNLITAPTAYVSKNTDSLDVCKYDLAAANAELDKAGWVKAADGIRAKGGIKLHVLYRTTVNALRQKEQDIVKAGWKQIGVDVELASVPAGTFFTNTSPDGANHFFADVEMYTNSGDPDPTSLLSSGWGTDNIAQKSNTWQKGNYARYSNAEFDKIIADLKKETDTAKRAQLVIAANDHLIKNVVIIPLINRSFATSGRAKTLKGVNPTPWDSEMWNIADWSK